MAERERRLAKRRKAVTGDVVPSVRPARDADDEGPSPEDIAKLDAVTQRCPECDTELFDDVAVCWNCGHVLDDAPKGTSVAQRWAMAVVVLIILAFLITVVL